MSCTMKSMTDPIQEAEAYILFSHVMFMLQCLHMLDRESRLTPDEELAKLAVFEELMELTVIPDFP